MSNAARFQTLFRGYTERFGRYDVKRVEDSGKHTGKAITVDKPLTADAYKAHVEGNYGIGVIPLTDTSEVFFAALDLDYYNEDDAWVWNVVVQIQDEPLLVTRSKSGGAHVWLFMAEPTPAQVAIDYLRLIAARIGYADCEVFPKQAARASQEDVGNWINLPYFGDTRKACVMQKTGLGFEQRVLELPQFLDVAEQCAKFTDEDKLRELSKLEKDQRQISEKTDDWVDGPPCLQRLLVGLPQAELDKIKRRFDEGKITEDQYHKQVAAAMPQLVDGGRDTTFFNAAQYLHRKHGGTWQEIERRLVKIHESWKARTGQPGLDDAELQKCAKQGAKDNWSYQCSVQPLKAFCHRGTCLRRKHGVSSGKSDLKGALEVTGFTQINTSPEKQFAFTANGHRVRMDSKTLLNQNLFAQRLLNDAGVVMPTLQEKAFREWVAELHANKDEIEGPPDADLRTTLLNHLLAFLNARRVVRGTGKDKKIFSGFALWSEDETEAWFRLDDLATFVRAQGEQIERKQVANLLLDELGARYKKGTTTIAERVCRPYIVDLAMLRNLQDDLAREGDELDDA